MTEMERMTQAESFVKRYFEFEDAIVVSNENREYLKTYIKDIDTVTREFNVDAKISRSIFASIGAALAVGLLLLIPCHRGALLLVPIIAFILLAVAGIVLFSSIHKYKLTAAQQHQREVNDGIREQIEILDLRIQQMEKQRDEYLAALQKKIDFVHLEVEDMEHFDVIKGYLEDGTVTTCEEAGELYEQNLLMAQMTDIIAQSGRKPKPAATQEENLERFGDPLKLIQEQKKKKKKEKKKK